MTNAIDLSIIIVSWNTADYLAACLTSIEAVIRRDEDSLTFDERRRTLEVIVVDNASADGSQRLVSERFSWATLIENETNIGFAAANNAGIRQARGRYIMLLNSDTEVHPGAMETLLRFMEERPAAGACGPRLLNTDGTLQPSCTPMLTPGRELWRLLFLDQIAPRASYPMARWDPGTPRPVEVIKGACMVLRRDALDAVGLLDESYFMYTEEVDLCFRLAAAGWELWWVPQAVVTHHGEASSRQVAQEMYLQLYRSKVQFYRKFGGEREANRFKRYLRIAYWPRLAIATLAAPFRSRLGAQRSTYRQLLKALSEM
ncbi:MAG: glycosyltransferase family 2 protein [Anaerolineae bacterium]